MQQIARHISSLRPRDAAGWCFAVFGAVVLISLWAGLATGWYFLAGLPVMLLVAYLTIVDFRKVFWLLLACLPLSTEVALPNGFGTDLPSEPVMVGLMLVYTLFVIQQGRRMSSRFLRHPITLLLLAHLAWIFTTTLTSDYFFVSLKFALAKTWYVAVFYFMAGSMLKTGRDVRIFFWVVFLPLMFTVAVTMVRHAGYGFSFADIHRVLHPFQRNHVNYAATMALIFPVAWLAVGWYPRGSFQRRFLIASLGLLFVAIYLSYTRAAYVALLLAFATWAIVRWGLMRYVLAGALLAALMAVMFMAHDNRYLDYAPNYDRTVSHQQFNSLIEATYKGEDISTMERVYRWVAGFQMSRDHPWLGYGPGNFVNFYRSYTVTSFQTYVSDNREQSGIHSYFLMTLVEQGLPGLFFFLLLCFFTLVRGEAVYRRSESPDRRRIVLMAMLCLVVIDAFLIINDLIETDKVGSFFFMAMAILVNMDLAERAESPPKAKKTAPNPKMPIFTP